MKQIKQFYRAITRPMPLESNFEDYDEYWKNRGFEAPSINRAKKMSSKIEPGSKILDIGCGDGTVLEYLKENNDPKHLLGLDLSKSAVDHVNKLGIPAKQMDVFSKEFEKLIRKETFDYVIITEVLEHLQDPEVLMMLLKGRVTKSIFVSIPNAGFITNRIRLMFGMFPLVMIQEHVKEHIRFWTKKDFIYWSDYLGYRVKALTVTAGMHVKILEPLENVWPSMFANQIMYEVTEKKGK